jgi:hypothetical protein
MCPLVCCAASGLVYPCEAQSEVAEKGAKRAILCAPLGPTRRRRSPLATAASHERPRGALPAHQGSPRDPHGYGPAAAGRRTDGGRWPEATRGVIRHSPRTWRLPFSQQSTPRACALGPFFCFRAPKSLAKRLPVEPPWTLPSAPSGSWRGCEADRPTCCRAGVRRPFAISRAARGTTRRPGWRRIFPAL